MIICVFLPIGEILPAKTKSCLQVVCVFAHYWWAKPIQAGTVKNCLQVVSKVSSRGRCRVVDVQHLLHHEETRVPLVVARDSKAKLLVDVDSSL